MESIKIFRKYHKVMHKGLKAWQISSDIIKVSRRQLQISVSDAKLFDIAYEPLKQEEDDMDREPSWFKSFRKENNKRWDENNKRWDENNKRWDENNKRLDCIETDLKLIKSLPTIKNEFKNQK